MKQLILGFAVILGIAFAAYEFLDDAPQYELAEGMENPAGSASGKQVWNAEGRSYMRERMDVPDGSMAKFRGTYRKLRGR